MAISEGGTIAQMLGNYDRPRQTAMHAGLPTTKTLLERNMDIIMGLGTPLSKTGDPNDKKLATAIIQGGSMAKLFTGRLL